MRLLHTALRTILAIAMAGLLGELDVEPWEIALVRDHQDCYACALAKWNRLSAVPSSGLHQLIAGSEWTGNIEGIYVTKAIEGFCYNTAFVELITGYGCVFLLKLRTEMMTCIKQVARYCNKHGHRMVRLFVDAGTVENGQALQDGAGINGVNEQRVNIRPASPERQQANPVERRIQTLGNHIDVVMVDQDFLPNWFWGRCNIAVWYARNRMSNALCPLSTPIYFLEGRTTVVSRMFKFSFGQTADVTKLGYQKNIPGVPKNEFAVAVCPEDNCTIFYLPTRSNASLAIRYYARAINLGEKPQLSLHEGQGYVTVLKDGAWHMVSRGDSNILGDNI